VSLCCHHPTHPPTHTRARARTHTHTHTFHTPSLCKEKVRTLAQPGAPPNSALLPRFPLLRALHPPRALTGGPVGQISRSHDQLRVDEQVRSSATHAHTHARARARTHTHTHTHTLVCRRRVGVIKAERLWRDGASWPLYFRTHTRGTAKQISLHR